MTNRHWYDDSNGEREREREREAGGSEEGGGGCSRESSFPSCHAFLLVQSLLFQVKFQGFVFFSFSQNLENGAINCAALGPILC